MIASTGFSKNRRSYHPEFRSVADSATLWEVVLPPEARQLPKRLAKADRLLADSRLPEVFRPYFSAEAGRKTIPMETFTRLMYLKSYLKMGYERLVEEVTGSITYRMFARIGIDQSVPDKSTLTYIVQRCGPAAIAGLNQVVIEIAAELGVVNVSKVRTDSTIVDANIAYPTDSGLLTKAIKKIVGAASKPTAGLGLDASAEDTTEELKDLNRQIGAWSRSKKPDRKDQILVLTDQIADLATRAGRGRCRRHRCGRGGHSRAQRYPPRAQIAHRRARRVGSGRLPSSRTGS